MGGQHSDILKEDTILHNILILSGKNIRCITTKNNETEKKCVIKKKERKTNQNKNLNLKHDFLKNSCRKETPVKKHSDWTQVQGPAPTWQLTAAYNSSSGDLMPSPRHACRKSTKAHKSKLKIKKKILIHSLHK